MEAIVYICLHWNIKIFLHKKTGRCRLSDYCKAKYGCLGRVSICYSQLRISKQFENEILVPPFDWFSFIFYKSLTTEQQQWLYLQDIEKAFVARS